jgi:drug/metabolite transporter (DMT)-like permease
MTHSDHIHVTRFKLIVAFSAVYLIWGSTYLGIRFAIETIPPFIMCGMRFVIGGLMMLMWARIQGAGWPSRVEWRNAAIIGTLMMVGGTGAVTWAEQTVPSGLTALVVGTVPLWIVFFDWLSPHGTKPTPLMILGLAIGTVGVGLLIAPGHFAGADHLNPIGAIVLVLGCGSWAFGSIRSRHANLPKPQTMSIAIQLLVAGAVLLVLAVFTGEWPELELSQISLKSSLSLMYLAVIGSLAFVAYIWLIKAAGPARAATYAYVNPVVAVILGSTFGSEPFALRTVLSALVIIVAVVLIITAKSRQTVKAAVPASNPSTIPPVTRLGAVAPATDET